MRFVFSDSATAELFWTAIEFASILNNQAAAETECAAAHFDSEKLSSSTSNEVFYPCFGLNLFFFDFHNIFSNQLWSSNPSKALPSGLERLIRLLMYTLQNNKLYKLITNNDRSQNMQN